MGFGYVFHRRKRVQQIIVEVPPLAGFAPHLPTVLILAPESDVAKWP